MLFFLVKGPSTKRTRSAFDNSEDQVAARSKIRRRNAALRSAATCERPKWSYVDQGDILIDTDIDMPKTGSYFYDLF